MVLNDPASTALGPLAIAAAEARVTREQVAALGVRLRDIAQPISELSGGNQQKVVLGRCLLTDPNVLLLDEPTRGVDIAAKAEIHRLIRQLADRGCAVVLISSELPEVLAALGPDRRVPRGPGRGGLRCPVRRRPSCSPRRPCRGRRLEAGKSARAGTRAGAAPAGVSGQRGRPWPWSSPHWR